MTTIKSINMSNLILGQKAANTRGRIFQAGIRQMKKNGYKGTTIRGICADAGVSIGAFYTYFKTKNDLFYDIYNLADDYMSQTVINNLEGDTATEKIIDFFRYYANLNIGTGLDLLRVLYNPENTWFTQRRPMQIVLENVVYEGQLKHELTDAIPSAEIVMLLYNMARGCCYNWCINDGNYDLNAQMTSYIDILLRGLHHASAAGEPPFTWPGTF